MPTDFEAVLVAVPVAVVEEGRCPPAGTQDSV